MAIDAQPPIQRTRKPSQTTPIEEAATAARAIDLAVDDARGRNGGAEMLGARTWLFDPRSRFATLVCRRLRIDPDRARLMLERRLRAQGLDRRMRYRRAASG